MFKQVVSSAPSELVCPQRLLSIGEGFKDKSTMTSVPMLGGDNLFERQFLFMSMSNVMDIVLLIPNIIKHRYGFTYC